MNLLITTCLLSLFANLCEAELKKEAYMSVPSLIKAAGYPIEKHRVNTEDGYILQMHRIPAGRRSAKRSAEPKAKGKKAILVVHGLVGSSGDFVIMGPERSLAYLLADAGYDVWLGNLRGNVYSAHKNLTRNNPQFWDYSFHEHGKYDVPAMIDRVLNITGLDRIMCLGYSMGTTSIFITLALKPHYNDKMIAYVAMGPAVYLDNIKGLAEFLFNTVNITGMMRASGVYGLQPQIIHYLIANLCTLKNPATDMCTNLIFSLVGEDYEQIDQDMMPIYLHRLQPASFRQLEHFGKIALTGEFTSWGDGMSTPVEPYNLTNVKAPVFLLYGGNDQLTKKSQILRLAERLSSTGVLEEVRPACSWPKFNHLDFIFAKDVGTLYNKPLITDIDRLYKKYSIV